MKRYQCIFRVDAGPGIGLGHLNRSTALAFALQKKGIKRIALLTRTPDEIRKHFNSFPLITITEKKEESLFWEEHFSENPPEMVIIDSYRVPETVLKKIKTFLPYVAAIDDYHHLAHYPVDAVINYHAAAHKIHYKVPKNTKLLRGLRYVLINSNLKRKVGPLSGKMRFYVSLGGSPEIPDMKKIAAALRPFRDTLQVDMAVGLSDNSIPIKESFIKFIPGKKAQAAMVRSHAAFVAVGVTAYELGFLGTPGILAVTAVNQETVAREMAQLGSFHNLGWLKKISVSKLSSEIEKFLKAYPKNLRMASQVKKIFDGKGSDRLASALIKYRKDLL